LHDNNEFTFNLPEKRFASMFDHFSFPLDFDQYGIKGRYQCYLHEKSKVN